MKCKIYDLEVYDSTLEATHGPHFSHTIREIHIPSGNGYIINERGHVFPKKKPRSKDYEITDIDSDIIKKIKEYAQIGIEIDNIITEIF